MAASLVLEDLNKYSEKLSDIIGDINEYSTFVETGTSYGASISAIYPYFEKIWTIELSEELYAFSNQFIKTLPHCTHVLGDSLVELPKYLKSLNKDEKVFFWLDAHYSSGNTARNHLDVPLIEECVIIDKNYQSCTGIVVIDDVRMFGTNVNEDWSYVSHDAVVASFNNFDIDFMEIVDDRLLLFISKSE